MKRKYRFNTRQEAEDSFRTVESEKWMLAECCGALSDGEVRWFHGKFHRVGLVNPLRSHGGLVMVRVVYTTNEKRSWSWPDVSTLDSWVAHVRTLPADSPELFDLHEVSFKAFSAAREAQEAAIQASVA